MRKVIILVSIFFSTLNYWSQTTINTANWPSMVGHWSFDNPSNLQEATIGSDLILTGTDQLVVGPTAGNNASRIGSGSNYLVNHGISPNGAGTAVNEYTLLIDFKAPTSGQFHSFYQTNLNNSNDGDMWINPSGNIGVGDLGYSSYQLIPGDWYRLILSVDLGGQYNYYLDGNQINGATSAIDGRFALDPSFFLFADENGEDNELDVALVMLFNTPLDSLDALTLGGYGHTIPQPVSPSGVNPYLQNPTPTSVYVSWHSDDLTSTEIWYGTSTSLSNQSIGSFENISGNNWHTVFLQNLVPNTEYFYQCVSGSDSSEVYAFKTAPTNGTTGEHLRFVIIGDSRSNILKTSEISDSIVQTLKRLYGTDWHNEVDLLLHTGDIVGDGNAISQYQTQFFFPYAKLTRHIPTMISIGNHEQESNYFYSYMKYEDLTNFGYPSGHPLNERFFAFKYLNNQFVFLNSNWQLHTQDQITWLEDVLTDSQADSTIDFVFTFGHHPGHSELWPDGNSSYVENDILEVLRFYHKCVQHNYGHSHNYERGAIEMQNSAPDLQHDMRIILQGGGGSALDRWGMYANQTDYPEIHRSLDHWSWTLVDVDVDNRSFNASLYSLGHNDKPIANEVVDTWYRKLDQDKGEQPVAMGIQYSNLGAPVIVGSQFNGADSIMTCHFQVTSSPGNYSTPTIDERVDYENLYGDSGPPNYLPVNLNQGVDLNRLDIGSYSLSTGTIYGYRVRYRDHNLRWTDWSEEKPFELEGNTLNSANFSAHDTVGIAPHLVLFSDLSNGSPTSWEWDFDNDGTVDSYDQDPSYIYTQDGDYSVSLTVNYNGGAVQSETKQFYIHVGTGTSVAQENIINSWSILPNPTSEEAQISINVKQEGEAKITVTDIKGTVVKTIKKLKLAQGETVINWNLTDNRGNKIAPGAYLIQVTVNKRSETHKLIVR